MKRVLALLAVAGGVAVLFATASDGPRRAIHPRLLTNSATCYVITWTKYVKTTEEIPCPAGSGEIGSAEYVLQPPTR